MGTTVTERTPDRTHDRATWSCPNCRGETSTAKKRCRDCGTSRF